MPYINITVSAEDYDKINDIEETKEVAMTTNKDIKGILLKTSSAEYILFTVDLNDRI
jgi:hypothetical protein